MNFDDKILKYSIKDKKIDKIDNSKKIRNMNSSQTNNIDFANDYVNNMSRYIVNPKFFNNKKKIQSRKHLSHSMIID